MMGSWKSCQWHHVHSRLPLGLLGMIVMTWAVESSLERAGDGFLDVTGLSWRASARAAWAEAVDSEVLCFGDSLVKFGIAPRLIEEHSGVPAYNLALNAGTAPASYFLLRRALEAGARPRALIVDVEPGILAMPPVATPPEFWAELVSVRDALDLAIRTRDADFLVRITIFRSIASLRYRHQICASLVAGLKGQDLANRSGLVAIQRNWKRDRGAQIMPPRDCERPDVDLSNPILFPSGWSGDRLNVSYFRRFLELASARGIPVFWVLPPYSAEIQALRERFGQDATISRFVAAIQSRYPGVVVIDGRRTGYDPSVFWDGMIHLDGRGARAFSNQVATVLNRDVAGEPAPRWVRLPAYRAPSSEGVLEDVEQSQVALDSSRGTRR